MDDRDEDEDEAAEGTRDTGDIPENRCCCCTCIFWGWALWDDRGV